MIDNDLHTSHGKLDPETSAPGVRVNQSGSKRSDSRQLLGTTDLLNIKEVVSSNTCGNTKAVIDQGARVLQKTLCKHVRQKVRAQLWDAKVLSGVVPSRSHFSEQEARNNAYEISVQTQLQHTILTNQNRHRLRMLLFPLLQTFSTTLLRTLRIHFRQSISESKLRPAPSA